MEFYAHTHTHAKHIQALANTYNLWVWTWREEETGKMLRHLLLVWLLLLHASSFFFFNPMWFNSIWPGCVFVVAVWTQPCDFIWALFQRHSLICFPYVQAKMTGDVISRRFPANVLQNWIGLWSEHCTASMSSSGVGFVGGRGWGGEQTGSIAHRNSLRILGCWQPCRVAETRL